MKKLFILLLAVAMVISFAACGSTDDVRGDQIDNTVSDDFSSDNDSIASGSQDEQFSLGVVDGLTYENDFIGLGCTLGNDWTFYTDEQIRELNNATIDMAGEDFAELMENATVIYDMYASKNDTFDNINITLEKVDVLQLIGLDIESNYEQLAPTMIQSIENMGYSNVTYEIGTATIGGEEYASFDLTAEIQGVKMYQTSISIKCNGYLANISVTTYEQNKVNDILKNFYLTK